MLVALGHEPAPLRRFARHSEDLVLRHAAAGPVGPVGALDVDEHGAAPTLGLVELQQRVAALVRSRVAPDAAAAAAVAQQHEGAWSRAGAQSVRGTFMRAGCCDAAERALPAELDASLTAAPQLLVLLVPSQPSAANGAVLAAADEPMHDHEHEHEHESDSAARKRKQAPQANVLAPRPTHMPRLAPPPTAPVHATLWLPLDSLFSNNAVQ